VGAGARTATAAGAASLVLLLVGCGGGEDAPVETLPPGRAGQAPALGPGGAPVQKAIWGPLELPDGRPAFPTYARLGVDVFQMQLRWAEIAPRRPADPVDPGDPAYRWPPEVEAAIRAAGARGIEVALLLTTTPGWANGGRAEIRAPEDPADFAEFARAAAARYPEVRDWMIWGEPNRADRFLPNAPGSPVGPRRYAELLEAAYGALEAASPANVVIGGMTFTGGTVRPPAFLRWMRLPSGLPPRLDHYGHNPYPFRVPDPAERPRPGGWRDLGDLDTLGTEVAAAYRPLGVEPKLWLSEFTVQSGEDSRFFAFHVSEAEQAEWLTAGYRAAEASGDVAALGWFTLLDRPAGDGSARWGLMTAAGEPKPAFDAYASIVGR
jgi:hypothetical protein